MPQTTIFVSNLAYGLETQELNDAFASFGDIIEVKIIKDRDSGRSKGFGFVSFATTDEANKALGMNGQELHGRTIRVNFARQQTNQHSEHSE